MKKNIFRISALVVAAFMSMTSCTDYLDKSPDSDISETEPYKNFRNFQGFVEELYNGIPAVTSNDYHNSWNLGEDELWEPADQRPLAYYIDQGNFRVIVTSGTYIYGFPRNGGSVTNSDKKGDKGHLWGLAWQSIRKANIGLANLDKLVDATQEERDLIEGQLLFFRGWYHFMLMQYWGGLPYIDHELPAGETPKLPTSELSGVCRDGCRRLPCRRQAPPRGLGPDYRRTPHTRQQQHACQQDHGARL